MFFYVSKPQSRPIFLGGFEWPIYGCKMIAVYTL
jgi:hypothetical protein